MGFACVLFDFGGTLDGPGEHWLQRFAFSYANAGVHPSDADLRDAFGYSTRRCYADAAMAGRRLRETIACHVQWQFEFLGYADETRAAAIVDGFVGRTRRSLEASRTFLRRWSTHTRLGVISNFYGNVHLLLDDAGIAPLLGTIVDSTVAGVAKPDPRIFALALERLEASAKETLFVGDSLDKDIAGARAAGLRTAWLPGTDGPGDHRAEADFVLDDFAQLETILA